MILQRRAIAKQNLCLAHPIPTTSLAPVPYRHRKLRHDQTLILLPLGRYCTLLDSVLATLNLIILRGA